MASNIFWLCKRWNSSVVCWLNQRRRAWAHIHKTCSERGSKGWRPKPCAKAYLEDLVASAHHRAHSNVATTNSCNLR